MKRNVMEDFRRDVSYRLYKQDDGALLLTATLHDRFHDILLEVTVDSETLAITAARVDFRRAPSGECPNVVKRLEMLVGLVIGKGLSRALTTALGGGEGCGNLRTLLMGLLPLALNVQAAAGFDDEQEMMAAIHDRLLGTCAGYVRPSERKG